MYHHLPNVIPYWWTLILIWVLTVITYCFQLPCTYIWVYFYPLDKFIQVELLSEFYTFMNFAKFSFLNWVLIYSPTSSKWMFVSLFSLVLSINNLRFILLNEKMLYSGFDLHLQVTWTYVLKFIFIGCLTFCFWKLLCLSCVVVFQLRKLLLFVC